jgi:hypothetical protein
MAGAARHEVFQLLPMPSAPGLCWTMVDAIRQLSVLQRRQRSLGYPPVFRAAQQMWKTYVTWWFRYRLDVHLLARDQVCRVGDHSLTFQVQYRCADHWPAGEVDKQVQENELADGYVHKPLESLPEFADRAVLLPEDALMAPVSVPCRGRQ